MDSQTAYESLLERFVVRHGPFEGKREAERRNTQDRRQHPKWNEQHAAVVEAGGGVYIPGTLGHLILFNSPKTRSTLALPENELTAEHVAAKIAESDSKFGL